MTQRLSAPDIGAKKHKNQKISALTAYDYTSAKIVDAAGVDLILVGDSLGMVVLGYDSTLPVTMEDMLHHTRAVMRGSEQAMVVGDMPYMSYHVSTEEAVRNAGRFVKDAGAQAVKLEGGRSRIPVIEAVLDAEIPVMGHLGLTPQSVNKFGGYRVQGKDAERAKELVEDARALEAAGCFSIVLEGIPTELAKRITETLTIPTIGIGAGPHCDGQILVFHDVFGFFPDLQPKFVRKYAEGFETLTEAGKRYIEDVQSGSFPNADESYHAPNPVPLKANQKA